jgi:hypothetical protein
MTKYSIATTFLTLSLILSGCGGGGGSDPSPDDGSPDTSNPDNGNPDPSTPDNGNPDPSNPDQGTPVGSAGLNDVTGNIGGSTRYLGFVDLDAFQAEGVYEVEASGGFFEYSFDLQGSLFNEELNEALDTCAVEIISTDIDDFLVPESPDIDTAATVALVGAGDVLTLTSPAGTYKSLNRGSFGNFIFYDAETATQSDAFPAPLTLDIPGDTFPAFANVPFPAVQPLIVNSPTSLQPITPATTFSWEAGSNPDGLIYIGASSFTASGDSLSVDCLAVDDGEFSIPAGAQAEMGEAFIGFGYTIWRESVVIYQQGDALLIVTSSIEGDTF